MKNHKSFLIQLLILISNTVLSQYIYRDAQFWLKNDIEIPLTKKLDFRSAQEVRFTENYSKFNYFYFDVGASYIPKSKYKFSIDYILVQYRRPEGSFSSRHQYNIAFYYKKKLNRFTIINRILQEAQYKDFYCDDRGKQLRDFYFREKFSIRYKISKRYIPYLSDELYFRMDNDYYRGINRNRICAGLLYSISKSNQLDLFFLHENNFNTNSPSRNYIIGIGFNKNLF